MRLLLAAALSIVCAFGGSQLRGNGKPLAWKDGKVTLRVSRVVHTSSGEAGVDRRETAESVHAVALDAIRAWTRAGRARVEIDLALTDAQAVSAGENIVTFTDPAPFDTGVCDKDRYITCTILSFGEDGAIATAAVAFNPYKRHSSLGFEGAHDIGLIMMHEMGHVLGLDHSFIADSAMLAEAEQAAAPGTPRLYAVRRLSEDDLSMLAALYPPAPLSGIAGVVKRNGAPAGGVRVLAMDGQGRVPHGAVTGEDGGYRLWLAPGEYTVAAEPSDGPASAAAERVAVAEGAISEGVELTVTAEPRLSVENVGVIAGGFYAGMARVDLARGRDHSLAMVRTPAGMAVEVMLPGAVARNGNSSSPTSAPQLVRQPVRLAADAPAGSYGFAVRAGALSTVLPGSLRVVPNPKLERIVDAETGEPATTLRAGRRYRAIGSDLAAEAAEADPALTQLAGIALRVGDRFVPLASVKPGEIVFVAPALAGEARVAVITGTLMESEPVTLQLALE